MRFLLALGVAAAVAACAKPAEPVKARFDEQAASYILKSGTGTLTGQAFARQVGGGVVTAAGETVYLTPVTPFFTEVRQRNERGERSIIDPSIDKFTKSTIADAEGRFAFRDLHPGEYMVFTQVRWSVAGDPQGGSVYASATVKNNATVSVVAAR